MVNKKAHGNGLRQLNRYCSGVSWTVTFHVYRFDFIGGMKDGMLEMANGHFFRGIRKINSRSSPTAYCFS